MEVIRVIRYSGNLQWIERTLKTSLKEDLLLPFGAIQMAVIPKENELEEIASTLKKMRHERR